MLPTWQAELAESFVRPADLLDFLNLDTALLLSSARAAQRFPFRVTRSYASRMRKGDPCDPLLLQVLPLQEELAEQDGFTMDPVGDLAALAAPGLLHKYHGRVLLITTGACAIHCRYCFRREFPYAAGMLGKRQEDEAAALIATDPAIREVILSGGDPLVLSDDRLAALAAKIAAIPHVRRLRIHSRLPVVLPSRVTPEFLDMLTRTRLKTVLVIHANHPDEFDAAVAEALDCLRRAGILLLNQSVLLRGVNDDADVLERLSETLMCLGVLPYYLHLLDKARGTAHFDVPVAEAMEVHRTLRERLPGYLVPRLVREDAGEPYKTPFG